MKSPFDEIDSTIEAWAKRHNLALIKDPAYRVAYLGSEHECCQIWVDAPSSGVVELHAAEVESQPDEEMRVDWSCSAAELESSLEAAVLHVRRWFVRHAAQT